MKFVSPGSTIRILEIIRLAIISTCLSAISTPVNGMYIDFFQDIFCVVNGSVTAGNSFD